jgi:hypothetical protein
VDIATDEEFIKTIMQLVYKHDIVLPDWIMSEMVTEGFSNVHGEEFAMPRWQRRQDRCELLEPRWANFPILASESSVPTPEGGITAEVIVVKSFEELEELHVNQVSACRPR